MQTSTHDGGEEVTDRYRSRRRDKLVHRRIGGSLLYATLQFNESVGFPVGLRHGSPTHEQRCRCR